MFNLFLISARLSLFFAFCSSNVLAVGNDASASVSHNAVQRTIIPHTMQLVQVFTPVSYDEVTSRLYSLLGPVNSAYVLIGATSLAELEARVGAVLGTSGFMHFSEIDHGAWFQLFNANPTPRFKLYVIGNPFIAETMIKFDLRAGYNVPPRLLVVQNGNGTKIVYHLPSSVIDLHGPANLTAAAAVLDQRLAALVSNITAVV